MRVWDVATGAMASEFDWRSGGFDFICELDWTSEGELIFLKATATTSPIFWIELREAETGRLLADIEEGMTGCGVTWNSALTFIAFTDVENDLVIIIDATSRQTIKKIQTGAAYAYLNLSFDETRLTVETGMSGNIEVWNIETGEKTAVLENSDYQTYPVRWSPDGSLIAGAVQDRTVILIWDAATGDVVLELGQAGRIVGIAWSPDGTKLAGIGSDAGYVWDVATGNAIAQFPGTPRSLGAVGWSPDGSLLALSNEIGTITLWGEE